MLKSEKLKSFRVRRVSFTLCLAKGEEMMEESREERQENG